MKKRNQMLSSLLAIAMAAGMLTGCGQQEAKKSGTDSTVQENSMQSGTLESARTEEQSTVVEDSDSVRISDEVITFTVAGRVDGTNANADWNETVQFKEYEERLGIRLEATTYVYDQWPTKMTLMFASDELPDILANANMGQSDLIKYAKDGYLLDFSQYLDVMPNLRRIMEEHPDYAAKITSIDGAIYGFPKLNGFSDASLIGAPWMSQTWLDNVGMEAPKTLDEFYNVLKAFKEQDANGNGDPNDEIPLGIRTHATMAEPILWAHGIYAANKYAYILQADEDGKVVLMDTTENYKDFLKFMHKLYDEGLMDQEVFIQSFAEMKEKVNDGLVGMTQNGVFSDQQETMNWFQTVGYTTEKYNPDRVVVVKSRIANVYTVVASAEVEHPEELAKFIDYLFTDEGALSTVNGYEGKSFDFLEVNGFGVADHSNYWEKAGKANVGEYNQQVAVAHAGFSIYTTTKGTIYDLLLNTKTEDLMSDEVCSATQLNAWRELAIREEGLRVISNYPTVVYTEEETTERATLYTDMYNYLKNSYAQFITGERDIDSDWDSHIAELNKMGLERLMEIEQAAYDRYCGK